MSARQVARTASLLLDKRLKVETLVPDSLGLSLGSSVGERKSGGERGGGAWGRTSSVQCSQMMILRAMGGFWTRWAAGLCGRALQCLLARCPVPSRRVNDP